MDSNDSPKPIERSEVLRLSYDFVLVVECYDEVLRMLRRILRDRGRAMAALCEIVGQGGEVSRRRRLLNTAEAHEERVTRVCRRLGPAVKELDEALEKHHAKYNELLGWK